MTAGHYDLYIEKGSTLRRTFTLLEDDDADIDLTGYTARLMVRNRTSDEEALIDWTDHLTVQGPEGVVELLLTDDETEAIEFTRGVYDLEIESPAGETTRVLEGAVSVLEDVTR